jgi:hypothetical protein
MSMLNNFISERFISSDSHTAKKGLMEPMPRVKMKTMNTTKSKGLAKSHHVQINA